MGKAKKSARVIKVETEPAWAVQEVSVRFEFKLTLVYRALHNLLSKLMKIID